jgi:LemA protein
MSTTAWVLLGIVAAVVLLAVATYNGLVGLRQRVRQAFADVDVQLKQRHDLVPNLVETVKGYASHERETLENVIKARNAAVAASGPAAQAQAENMLSGMLRQLFALAEAYPDLKASTNFLELQRELSKLEDEIQMARRYYNGAVRNLNTMIETIPSNIVAGLTGFQQRAYFELTEPTERNVPRVQV